jgi:hypothetical protein
MFGRVSRTIMSVVRPVDTGRFVSGHLITISLTGNLLTRRRRAAAKSFPIPAAARIKNTISNAQG